MKRAEKYAWPCLAQDLLKSYGSSQNQFLLKWNSLKTIRNNCWVLRAPTLFYSYVTFPNYYTRWY